MTRTLYPIHRNFSRHRSGFTLVELLVAVTIMVILASTTLYATYSVRESARVAKTQATISKLNSLIMSKWDSYLSRRVPVNTLGMSPLQAAEARRAGLYELMRLELPSRWIDVTQPPQILGNYVPGPDAAEKARPSLSKAYQRYIDSAGNKNHANFQQLSAAECLYMIVAVAFADEAAIDRFDETEIADVDGDGFKEFVDGWGTPIYFVRWAPSFNSDLQVFKNGFPDFTNHPDPFDPTRRRSKSWALYPLIISAGSDKIFDIQMGNGTSLINDPFDGNEDTERIGMAEDLAMGALFNDPNANGVENHHDNVHNHQLKATLR